MLLIMRQIVWNRPCSKGAIMSSVFEDVRYAIRVLLKSPGFTAVALLAIALGVGANTAMFSVVNSILLRPLPFRDSNRMVVMWETSKTQGWARMGPSSPNYLDFREQSKSLEDLALIQPGTGTFTGFGEPQQLPAMRVSTNFLTVLGVEPILGRNFLPTEGFDQHVAILSHKLWDRYFGRARDAIGKRVTIDGLAYTVIGVLPPTFWSPDPAEALAPWSDMDLRARSRMDHDFGVIGHLKRGVLPEQANVEMNLIEQRIAAREVGMKDFGVTVVPLQQALGENVRTGLYLLLAAVALVLLIACANLANLMLARAAGRGRETAIRMALGAGRWRLARQFLTESAVLGVIGGALGLMFAAWGVDLLDRLVPQTMQLSGGAGEVVRPAIQTDGWALLFTLTASVVTGLIFGLAPAFAASKTKVNDALKEGARGSTAGGNRLRNIFVVSEVALALVLLIGSALLLKSFWRIQQVNPGFTPDHLLSLKMELPTDSRYRTPPEQAEFFRRVLEKVGSLAMIRSAAVANLTPLDTSDEPRVGFLIDGRAPLPSGQTLPADFRAVSPEYFRTLGIALRKGRFFTSADNADRPNVAIISESLARSYWTDGTDPIGQRLRFGRGLREVVGIVGDTKNSGLDKQSNPTLYTCYLQTPQMRMSLVARTAADPAAMIREVKSQVYAVDKDQPMYDIRTMDQVVAESQSAQRFTLRLLGLFAVVALLLAAAGIYGVISYGVTQRAREIGIRIALGAKPGDVMQMVLGRGALMTGAGIAAGLIAAVALTRVMSTLLFGVSATDPWIFTGASVMLGAVALFATYLPARRAMAVDPMISLRHE
jgi:putative ABC transport system permease protein